MGNQSNHHNSAGNKITTTDNTAVQAVRAAPVLKSTRRSKFISGFKNIKKIPILPDSIIKIYMNLNINELGSNIVADSCILNDMDRKLVAERHRINKALELNNVTTAITTYNSTTVPMDRLAVNADAAVKMAVKAAYNGRCQYVSTGGGGAAAASAVVTTPQQQNDDSFTTAVAVYDEICVLDEAIVNDQCVEDDVNDHFKSVSLTVREYVPRQIKCITFSF